MQILLNCKQHFLIFPGILSDKHKNSIQFDHKCHFKQKIINAKQLHVPCHTNSADLFGSMSQWTQHLSGLK